MNKEELHKRVAEDLWASFGYDSPEEHAVFLIKLISDIYIREFLDDLLAFNYARNTEVQIIDLREKWEVKLK